MICRSNTPMCFDHEMPQNEKVKHKKTLETEKVQQPELERAEERPIAA